MPSEEARMAKALEKIAHHNGEMVRVLATLNENVVGVAKIFKTWLDEEDANKDPNQLALAVDKDKCPSCGLLYCEADCPDPKPEGAE